MKFFWGEGAGLAPTPQPGGPGCLSSSGFYPCGLGVPAGSYATAGIALGVTEALKLPHHVKVETPSGEAGYTVYDKYEVWLLSNETSYRTVLF